jgi:arsenate reductase (thioredoxin)
VRWADVVVTMGCGDECPYVPGKRYVDWQIPDPSEKSSVEEIEPIARLLSDHVDRLLTELG